MKTVLITGIGGLTPRSIARDIRRLHPTYRLDANKKATGFFMPGLVDECFVVPPCTSSNYFAAIEAIVREQEINYAFVQPESEIVEWARYREERGEYPCPTFIGSERISSALKDKAVMASVLNGTDFIPKTIAVSKDNPRIEEVRESIGFPCWIRAAEGTGGLGSLRLNDVNAYKSWLMINEQIPEFTVSEFLPGRHLANQMLYYEGEYVKGAALECVEYVMANAAPSHVTGNTHFARFLNEDQINEFCNDCMRYLEKQLREVAHGIYSFDLKEDANGSLKVTEINIRHMAYTGVMALAGFDLIEDTIKILEDGCCDGVERAPFFHYEKPYVFLRDVDIEPILLDSEDVFTYNVHDASVMV